jgi:selenocysteine-specific elongation factor
MTVVVGTAGHIDHGKTTLLRALTGIDADRLPEERRRGMTIEVGYAHLALADGDVLDFVDVPGHDRLVGNMLVGAGEIDAVLLVVAADDGPRAQTLEHLELLDALGLVAAVVAVTKTDLVPAERVAAVVDEVRALVDRTTLAGAPILPVSAATGAGLDELRAALVELRDRARRDGAGAAGPLRLAVDRVFGVKGRGIVVTGTLRGGPLARNAPLRLEPGGLAVRPRELQVRGTAVQRGGPGGRLAANLAGVDRTAVGRGSVLTEDPAVVATDRLLVALRPSLRLGATGPTDRAPLAGGTLVRLHLGTAQAAGIIRRGRRDVVGLPGGELTAILRLAAPVAAAAGDRCVLRRPSPAEPLAGGRILDPRPPTGAAWRHAAAADVEALARATSPAERAAARLALHGALPLCDRDVAALRPGAAVKAGGVLLLPALAAAAVGEARAAVEAATGDGVPLAELRVRAGRILRRRASIAPQVANDAAGTLLDAAVAAGQLARTGELVHARGRAIGPTQAVLAAMDRLERALEVPAPPGLLEAARAAGCPPEGVHALESAGRIVRVDRDLAWSARAFADLQATALRLAADRPLTPAALRDATGTSRKYVMALLEDLGRRGILARTPAGHVSGPRAPHGKSGDSTPTGEDQRN